jgi:hypothetical protein
VNPSRRILIFGGLALAAMGMTYGLHYALFVEHQTLDGMGSSLADAFASAAARKMPEAQRAVTDFAATKYDYVRQVDVHSHWIGLAMLMILLGVAFDQVAWSERFRRLLAWGMLLGSALFPLGVMFQTSDHGFWPRGLAILGSGLVMASLALIAFGFARKT